MLSTKKGFKLSLVSLCLAASFPTSAYWTATRLDAAAQVPLKQLQLDYVSAASEITVGLTKGTQEVVGATSAGAVELTKGIHTSSSQATQDYMHYMNVQTSTMMEFEGELAAQRARDAMVPIPGLRKEMITEVRNILQRPDLAKSNVTEIVQYAIDNVDGTRISVMPETPMKPDENGELPCDAIECGLEVPFYPSQIIEHYAGLCNSNKAAQIAREEAEAARAQRRLEDAKKDFWGMFSSADSDSVNEREELTREATCDPSDKGVGLCGSEMDNNEYVRAMLANEIIPNGDVSASNFYSPASVGGVGYVDLKSDEIEDLVTLNEYRSVDRSDNNALGGVPPLNETYRTESQLRAASAFADNIISSDVVYNQNIDERNQAASAQFQAAYRARLASLSMARNAFSNSISDRRGSALTDVDITLPPSEDIVREKEDGAGHLDKLNFKVSQNLDLYSAGNMESVASMNEKALLEELVKQSHTSNEFAFEEILKLEMQALLLATLVAQETNSPQNVQYLQSVGGR